jgi:uncharacterized circularly permuted ATP-grasp superfamily protein
MLESISPRRWGLPVFMRTTKGPKRVDVIYRRIDAATKTLNSWLIGVPGSLGVGARAARVSLGPIPMDSEHTPRA